MRNKDYIEKGDFSQDVIKYEENHSMNDEIQ